MRKPEFLWEELHAIVFAEYIDALNKEKIKYFILRNYEDLPEKNESKDVDIIIKPGSYKKASKLLLDVFKKYDISNYYVVKYEKVRCWFGIDMTKNFFIHIDLIEGYVNKGFEIFSFNTLYKNTIIYKNFKVLNEEYDAAMLLLYKVINAKQLKEKYRIKIERSYNKNAEKINKILKKVLDKRNAELLIGLLKKEDYDAIVDNARMISKSTKIKAFKKKPIHTVKNIILFGIEKFYRIVICPKKYKKFIAVEAPDGTGKTTFIDELCVRLAEMFVCDIEKMHVYHFRPTILPNLGAVGEKAGVMKQDTDFTNPHRNKPANKISSFIRMAYYWMDYIIGGIICIRKDVQFDKFSIFDRYIYDFIVDPYRSRINLPLPIRKLFVKTVHQPQIVFVLMADAEVVYNRKQELTLYEITRQLKEFKKLKDVSSNCFMLNANLTPDEIVDEAMKVIMDKYTLKVPKDVRNG